MTLRKKLLPTFPKAVSGQTATVNLDLGKKYHVIWLILGYDAANANKALMPAAVANDMIGEVRLLVNGKVQRRVRGRELNALNKLMGSQFASRDSVDIASGGALGATGYRVRVPIFLAEPWRKSNAEAALMGWNLAGPTVASASLEVDWNTIDTPFISGYYEWSQPDGGLGAITKWVRTTHGAAGDKQDFALEKRDFYHSLHLFAPTGGYVQKVQLTADGVIIQDLLAAEDNQVMLINRDLNPETLQSYAGPVGPRFDLVLDADDPVNSALQAQGLQEFTLHVEYSASVTGNLVVIAQRSGPPD